MVMAKVLPHPSRDTENLECYLRRLADAVANGEYAGVVVLEQSVTDGGVAWSFHHDLLSGASAEASIALQLLAEHFRNKAVALEFDD